MAFQRPEPRLCLSLFFFFVLAHVVGAQDLQQSVAITMAPGPSTIESLQLTVPVTVPVVFQTTTQVSMVTVTQMSLQTSTVMSTVTQMQMVTVQGTCAASAPDVASQTALAVVTAGALDQMDSAISATSTIPNSSATASTSASTVLRAAATSSSAPAEACDCSCLCPLSAFPMGAIVSATGPFSVAPKSTFQTVASASAVNKVAVSSSMGSPAVSSVAVTSSSMSIPAMTTADPATGSTSKPGVLPSAIVTDPGIPTGRPQIQDAQNAPINIETYQLMKSVGLPVVVGRTVVVSTTAVEG